jgi:molecular chaperone HscC
MQSLGTQREHIAEWLHSFTTVLGGQQSAEIASHRTELNKALDQLRL